MVQAGIRNDLETKNLLGEGREIRAILSKSHKTARENRRRKARCWTLAGLRRYLLCPALVDPTLVKTVDLFVDVDDHPGPSYGVTVGGQKLWEVTLPHPAHPGLPYGRPLYFQTGHFTGRPGEDVYVYAGTPMVRSLLLDGRTGDVVWERGELPGMERYFGDTLP